MIGMALDRPLVRRFFEHAPVAYVQAAPRW